MLCLVSMRIGGALSELLAQDEVEMTSAVCADSLHLVKTVCPVYTQKTDHRQEYSCADTNRLLHIKRIHFTDTAPAVATFGKYESEDIGAGPEHEGVSQFY